VRLLTIAVLQPIVSPLLSIPWRLITPYIRPFCFKNDGTVVTLTRTTCNALCAVMTTQFLYMLSCSLSLGVSEVGRNCARASCARCRAGTRGLCAQQWFGLGHECTRLSFERRGAVLWTDPPVSVWTSVANCCHLRAGCSRSAAWAGARRVARCTTCLRFQLRDQSAPSCAHCCARMRGRCARRAKRCRLSRGRAISNWHSHSVHCSSLVPTAWRNCSRAVMYVASA